MKIDTAVVCGASGTVGSLTGGILAQNDIRVYFLSRTKAGAEKGLQKAIGQARSDVIADNIICGDYGLLAQACGQADWVIEAVAEDIAVKQSLYEQIDRYRRAGSVVSTLTSSLPLEQLPTGRSEDFQKRFLSTHFYNPPGKLTACEVCGTSKTDPELISQMMTFLRQRLRRTVVPVKPTAGFIGNRIAFVLFSWITELATEYGVELMDYLIGPYTGRAMPPLATIDLVGLDIHAAIIHNLKANVRDPLTHLLNLPAYVQKMLQNGQLGRKAKENGGFYKKIAEDQFVFLDPKTMDYIPPKKPRVDFVEAAKEMMHIGKYRDGFDILFSAEGDYAQMAQKFLATYVAYAYLLIGNASDEQYGIEPIDNVMTSGFSWASPSMIVYLMGGKQKAVEMLKRFDLPVSQSLMNDMVCQKRPVGVGRFLIAK